MKNGKIPVIVVTIYLVIYTAMATISVWPNIVLLMFSLSPILVLWMVYSVLKFGKYTGRKLKKDDEFGYSDIEE